MRTAILMLMVPVAFALTFKVWWTSDGQPFVSYKPWTNQQTTLCSNVSALVRIVAHLKGVGDVKLFEGEVSGCKNVTLKSLGPLALLAQSVSMDVKVGNVTIRDFEYLRASTGDLCLKYELLTLPPATPGGDLLLLVKNVCPFKVRLGAFIDPFGLNFFDVTIGANKSYLLAFKMPKMYDNLLKDIYIVVNANGTKSVIASIPAFNYVLNYLIPYSKVVWVSNGRAVSSPSGWSEACVTLPPARPYVEVVPVRVTYTVYQEVYASQPRPVAKVTFVAKSINDFERCIRFYAKEGFPILGYYVVAKVGNVEWRVKG